MNNETSQSNKAPDLASVDSPSIIFYVKQINVIRV